MFENLTVAAAMKTNYLSVSMTTPLVEALDLMLAEKQPFVMVTENNRSVIGLLALKNIQDFCRAAKDTRAQDEVRCDVEFCIVHRFGKLKVKFFFEIYRYFVVSTQRSCIIVLPMNLNQFC
jgi:hypothetical protein